MRRLSIVLALASLVGAAPAVLADSIPYADKGTPTTSTTLVATSTGDVTGYFVGVEADIDSMIRMVNVTTGVTSDWYFPNHSTAVGTSAVFGSVNAGDILTFELLSIGYGTFSTDAADNVDGVSHGYVTDFSGGSLGTATFPAGTYIGFEDLPAQYADFDYNDNQFLFTNVSIAATPEPGSLVLLGTGILGVAGVVRRRMFAN